MTPTSFDVLDRLMSADGPLKKPALAIEGMKKKDSEALLAKTVEDALVTVAKGNHSLTDKGREAWEAHAPPEKRAARAAKLRERERVALVAFLQAVEAKKGKAFTDKELQKHSATSAAVEQKLAEADGKKYRLLDAGETLLLGEQPIETQLAGLKAKQEALGKALHAAMQRTQADLGAAGLEALRATASALDGQRQQAMDGLADVLRKLEAFGGTAEAAAGFQARLDAMAQEARKASESAEKLTAEQGRIERTAREEGERIEASLRAIEGRLADLAKRPAPAPVAAPATAGPTDDELWAATMAAYGRLHDPRVKAPVKVPDLADQVLAALPGVGVRAFHEALQRWAADGRIALQLCNLRHTEPRNAEGIESPRGLLFYVQAL